MERIQMALEKARAKRAGAGAGKPVAVDTAADPAPPADASGQDTTQDTAQGSQQPAAPDAPDAAAPPAPRQPAPQQVPRAVPAPAAPVAHPARATAEAEARSGAEITAEIRARWQDLPAFSPRPALMAHNRIIGYTGGREAGPVDMMRTRILQEMRKNGWRRLAVTSPNPGCGKTTTCLNLAFSLGRQANQRTVVADLDMRRPGMAKMLGLQQPQRFSQVIAGEAAARDHLVRYGTNLAFGTVDAPARNPAELLQGAEIGPALSRLEADYAVTAMIFDMPPMMMSDDMMAFAPHVDCVLLLAGAETTALDDLDRCERELAGVTNVLGVVLNKCRYMEPGYGYGYY